MSSTSNTQSSPQGMEESSPNISNSQKLPVFDAPTFTGAQPAFRLPSETQSTGISGTPQGNFAATSTPFMQPAAGFQFSPNIKPNLNFGIYH